jgi:hypothetical protein
MACIWDLEKNLRGKLSQGWMIKKNYFWEFPLTRHFSQTEERQKLQAKALTDVRSQRDTDKTYRR